MPALPTLQVSPAAQRRLVVGASVAAVVIAITARSVDLDVYLRAASDVVTGRDPNVTPERALPWLYPPVAALGFVPLLPLPFPIATAVFALISVAALARVLWLVVQRVAPGHTGLVPLLLAAAIVTEPVYATLGFGQINLLLAWLVTEGFLGRRRWLIGVAAGLKLTPLIFVLPLLLRRDWRAVGQVLAGFVASVVLGLGVAPGASVTYWGGLFLRAPERIGTAYASNQSLTGAVWRAVGDGGSAPLTWALSAVVLALAVIIVLRTRDDAIALSVTGIAGLLVSPISWTHHWVWVLPLILWCLANGRRGLGFVWTAAVLLRPVWWWPADGPEYTHDLIGKLSQDTWTILAVVTLGVLAVARARGAEPPPEASEPAWENAGVAES